MNNDNFLVNGAQTLSQTPILRVEGHATDAFWLSADVYYNVGGEPSIDGIRQNNMANTLRADVVVNDIVVAKPSGGAGFANNTLYRQAVVVKPHDQ
jgi:hypothetical protein